jgi:NTP pyrophosphatase (non-canonical NTP hydrolase)
MELNEYQDRAESFAITGDPTTNRSEMEAVFGLLEEAGELAGKYKRYYRDKIMNPDDVRKELGDILWYLARVARCSGFYLEEIASYNLEKLEDRKNRNVISGKGDNR